MVRTILLLLLVLPGAMCVNYTLKSAFNVDSPVARVLIGTTLTSAALIGTAILLRDEL